MVQIQFATQTLDPYRVLNTIGNPVSYKRWTPTGYRSNYNRQNKMVNCLNSFYFIVYNRTLFIKLMNWREGHPEFK